MINNEAGRRESEDELHLIFLYIKANRMGKRWIG